MVVNELIASLIIAIVQGITEWLPVSSSGHLVLAEKIIGHVGGLTFDVALHFGTLMAVFVYFGKDIIDIMRDFLSGKFKTENGKLGVLILVATIPAAIVGFLFKDVFSLIFSNLVVVMVGFAITGVLLLIASVSGKSKRTIKGISFRDAATIGIAQVFSIFPGVSRSGTTLSAGLLLGLEEKAAVKFSFLMSIPIIFGANILVIGNDKLPPNLIWATLASFLIGLITIHVLYKRVLTKKKNLKWFAFYALALAIAIFLWLVFN